jgi:hypothetical protein
LGLIAVMSEPGGETHGSPSQAVTSVPWVTVTGSTITVNPTRQTRFLVVGDVSGTSSGSFGYTTIGLDGASQGLTATQVVVAASSGQENGSMLFTATVQPGTHTFSIMAHVDTGVTFTVNFFDLYVFTLGAA